MKNSIKYKFSYICNFTDFDQAFINSSPKRKTKKLEIIYTILISFYSFLNGEGVVSRPQIRHTEISVLTIIENWRKLAAT